MPAQNRLWAQHMDGVQRPGSPCCDVRPQCDGNDLLPAAFGPAPPGIVAPGGAGALDGSPSALAATRYFTNSILRTKARATALPRALFVSIEMPKPLISGLSFSPKVRLKTSAIGYSVVINSPTFGWATQMKRPPALK